MSRLNLDIGDLDFSDSMAPVIKLRLIPHRGLKWKSKGENEQEEKVIQASELPPKRDSSQPASLSRSISGTCHAVATGGA
jgi:hypothetical protein